MKLRIMCDIHILCIGLPKLIANFGLFKPKLQVRAQCGFFFFYVIVDIIEQILTIWLPVVLSICPSSENNILPILHSVYRCWFLPVCCSVPINGDHHLHSHFHQTLSERVAVASRLRHQYWNIRHPALLYSSAWKWITAFTGNRHSLSCQVLHSYILWQHWLELGHMLLLLEKRNEFHFWIQNCKKENRNRMTEVSFKHKLYTSLKFAT